VKLPAVTVPTTTFSAAGSGVELPQAARVSAARADSSAMLFFTFDSFVSLSRAAAREVWGSESERVMMQP